MTKSPTRRAAHALRNELAVLDHRLGPIEHRQLTSLNRFETNPRKHPEKQLAALTASILEFGIAIPLLIDEHDTIIAGEARVEAANRAGMTEVPVIVANQWSRAQVRAYRLAYNRLAELATWDGATLAIELAAIIEFDEISIEALGWETAGIDLILDAEVNQPDGKGSDPADDQLVPPANPVSRPGDLWILGEHRLLCGSSLDPANWTRLLDGRIAAMAFTAPPDDVPVCDHVRGLGEVSHGEIATASGEMMKVEFTAFLSEFIAAMLPHCKDGAVLDLCIDRRHIGELQTAIEANALTNLDLCVWNKANEGTSALYRSKHELIFIAKKGSAPHTNNVDQGKHGRYRTNVWDYTEVRPSGQDGLRKSSEHPTAKPTALVADAICDVTHAGEVVLDAFVGSGTTLLACERTKRRGYGIEIEPRYVDVAIRRWQKLSGEEALLAQSGEPFAVVARQRIACDSVSELASAALAHPSLADAPA